MTIFSLERAAMAGVLGAVAVALTAAASLTTAASLTYTAPDAWTAEQPASSMRVAEFTLPRAAGDTDDAQLVIYYFGGQGGSVDANIHRWLAQIETPSGAAAKTAKTETRTVNGLAVSLVDASGTYVAEMSPGSREHHNQPHFRLRAGVVQTPKGPYFIKLTGPQKTVAKWEAAFDQFVSSLRYVPGGGLR
jgi:hypothetical protein